MGHYNFFSAITEHVWKLIFINMQNKFDQDTWKICEVIENWYVILNMQNFLGYHTNMVKLLM